MEFNFIICKDFNVDNEGFFIIEGNKLPSSLGPSPYPQYNKKYNEIPGKDKTQKLAEILNRMGEASSKAQELRTIITCYEKVWSSDVTIFMKVEENRVLGFIKTGKKSLFYRDYVGTVKQIMPLCVLDFYVHESVQRNGIGKQIFEKMLEFENKKASQLAYDRPSPKLLGFLKKHYHLVNYIPQNNNFVIYQQFFDTSIRPNSEVKNQKPGFSDNKLNAKSISISTSNSFSQREDFSKVGKQLIEKNYYNEKNSKIDQSSNFNQIENHEFIKENSIKNKGNVKQNLKDVNYPQNAEKEEIHLSEIQNKISKTEKELAEVQNKLANLQIGVNQPNFKKNNLSNTEKITHQQTNSNNSYDVRPPWATNYTNNLMHTTSNSYGNHYYSKQYYNK